MSDWVVFVMIGDSVMAGFQQGPGSRPPRHYPFTNVLESSLRMKLKSLGSDFDVAVENKGVNGDSTSGMVERFQRSVVPEKPNYVAIMGGLNDLFTRIPVDDVYKNIIQLTQLTKEAGAEPIMLSTTPVAGSPPFNATIKELNDRVAEYCAANGVRFIDLYSEFLSEGVLAAEYSNDGVHISDKGYGKIIQVLTPLFLELVTG